MVSPAAVRSALLAAAGLASVAAASAAGAALGDANNMQEYQRGPTPSMAHQTQEWLLCGNVTGLNASLDNYCNDTLGNGSANGNATLGGPFAGKDQMSDVILMVVTSVVLGLMILITVIGESPHPRGYQGP